MAHLSSTFRSCLLENRTTQYGRDAPVQHKWMRCYSRRGERARLLLSLSGSCIGCRCEQNNLSKLCPAVLFLLLTMSAPSQAVPIISTIKDPTGSGGGFWIGAFDIGPDNPRAGPRRTQQICRRAKFHSIRDYSNITAAVVRCTTGACRWSRSRSILNWLLMTMESLALRLRA